MGEIRAWEAILRAGGDRTLGEGEGARGFRTPVNDALMNILVVKIYLKKHSTWRCSGGTGRQAREESISGGVDRGEKFSLSDLSWAKASEHEQVG